MTDRYNDLTDEEARVILHKGTEFPGTGERLTEKNTRHCVNSVSMQFYDAGQEIPPTIRIADE